MSKRFSKLYPIYAATLGEAQALHFLAAPTISTAQLQLNAPRKDNAQEMYTAPRQSGNP